MTLSLFRKPAENLTLSERNHLHQTSSEVFDLKPTREDYIVDVEFVDGDHPGTT
jgi:hypothetical protein